MNQYYCNEILLEDLEISGQEIAWYFDSDLLQPIESETVFTTSQTIFATQKLNNCESLDHAVVNINIEYPPALFDSFDPIEVCDQGAGMSIFNLYDLKDLSGVIESNDLITFYDNYDDADMGINSFSETTPHYFYDAINPIYMRVEEEICYRLYRFETVREICTPIIPQGFSPNGDLVNDYFNIQYLYDVFYDHKLTIYSRWGTIVFEGDNSNKWNGISNRGLSSGSLVPVGTYFYRLDLNNQSRDIFTGWVYVNY